MVWSDRLMAVVVGLMVVVIGGSGGRKILRGKEESSWRRERQCDLKKKEKEGLHPLSL